MVKALVKVISSFLVNKNISKIEKNQFPDNNKVREPEVDYIQYRIRKIDNTWDFKDSNTKEFTHCFHTYPAMMIPQVARRIIETYGQDAQLLFDPYCGTGTSLVESNLHGINAIGTDINPLARLIATTKTTRIDLQLLDKYIEDFVDISFTTNFKTEELDNVNIPKVTNIDYWFSKRTQKILGFILEFIKKIKIDSIKNFFKVAFSESIRDVSYIKSGEFKLVRSKKLEGDKNVFAIMTAKLFRNRKGLSDFENICPIDSETHVFDFNTIYGIPNFIIESNSVDIVLTSPPYGDSQTTVAYGQYSRLANEWLGFPRANQIDKMLMGGRKVNHDLIFGSEVLNKIIDLIKKEDSKRAKDVVSFYQDYENSINNVAKIIKYGGYACYVVGNRTVKGITIPTDEITAQLFEMNGFRHVETIVRNIPNKRMPLKNSPSNIAGITANTMKNEYIVICKKVI